MRLLQASDHPFHHHARVVTECYKSKPLLVIVTTAQSQTNACPRDAPYACTVDSCPAEAKQNSGQENVGIMQH